MSVLTPGVRVRTEWNCIAGNPAGIGELVAVGVGKHHIFNVRSGVRRKTAHLFHEAVVKTKPVRTHLALRTVQGAQKLSVSVSYTVNYLQNPRTGERRRRVVSNNQLVEDSLRAHCVPSCVLGSPGRPEEQMWLSNTFFLLGSAYWLVPATLHTHTHTHTHTHACAHTHTHTPHFTGQAMWNRSCSEVKKP